MTVEISTLGSTIKTAYEGESNTNAFTDAEQTKLSALPTAAELGGTSNGQGASLIGLEDATAKISATNVEDALVENREAIDAVEALLPSGTIVGTSDTQTLTNKTHTAPKVRFGAISSSAARNFALSDEGSIVALTGSTARTFTIPAQSSVAWSDNTELFAEQHGTGALSITVPAGVTLNDTDAGTATLNGQYSDIRLRRRGEDDWLIYGAHGGVS